MVGRASAALKSSPSDTTAPPSFRVIWLTPTASSDGLGREFDQIQGQRPGGRPLLAPCGFAEATLWGLPGSLRPGAAGRPSERRLQAMRALWRRTPRSRAGMRALVALPIVAARSSVNCSCSASRRCSVITPRSDRARDTPRGGPDGGCPKTVSNRGATARLQKVSLSPLDEASGAAGGPNHERRAPPRRPVDVASSKAPVGLARRHPELVADEPPAAALQNRRAANPACAVLRAPACRKSLDREPLSADSRADRAAGVAPDLIGRTAWETVTSGRHTGRGCR
jgi:hypothetical protein